MEKTKLENHAGTLSKYHASQIKQNKANNYSSTLRANDKPDTFESPAFGASENDSQKKKTPWSRIIAAGTAIIAIVVAIVYLIKRKKPDDLEKTVKNGEEQINNALNEAKPPVKKPLKYEIIPEGEVPAKTEVSGSEEIKVSGSQDIEPPKADSLAEGTPPNEAIVSEGINAEVQYVEPEVLAKAPSPEPTKVPETEVKKPNTNEPPKEEISKPVESKDAEQPNAEPAKITIQPNVKQECLDKINKLAGQEMPDDVYKALIDSIINEHGCDGIEEKALKILQKNLEGDNVSARKTVSELLRSEAWHSEPQKAEEYFDYAYKVASNGSSNDGVSFELLCDMERIYKGYSNVNFKHTDEVRAKLDEYLSKMFEDYFGQDIGLERDLQKSLVRSMARIRAREQLKFVKKYDLNNAITDVLNPNLNFNKENDKLDLLINGLKKLGKEYEEVGSDLNCLNMKDQEKLKTAETCFNKVVDVLTNKGQAEAAKKELEELKQFYSKYASYNGFNEAGKVAEKENLINNMSVTTFNDFINNNPAPSTPTDDFTPTPLDNTFIKPEEYPPADSGFPSFETEGDFGDFIGEFEWEPGE